MVLASQTPRKINTWRHMTNEGRRRRPFPRLLLLGVVVAAVAFGAWIIFFRNRPEQKGGGVVEESRPATERGAEGLPPPPSLAADAIRGTGAGEVPPSTPEIANKEPAANRFDDEVVTMGGGADDPSIDKSARGPVPGSDPGVAPARPTQPTPQPAALLAAPPASKGPPAEPPNDGRRGAGGIAPEPLSAAIALAERDPIVARERLSAMVEDDRLSTAERSKAREAIGAINRRLLFSSVVVPGDPLARTYDVKPGDSLQKIARSQGLGADWRFIKRVNGIDDERKLKAGQTLKMVPGVFHAIVDKSDYRMDLFVEREGRRTFVCSLPVGLGELNSTPVGRFKVRQSSKLVNPAWTNPRTGEHFRADDPKNPIGEFWIGLKGIDEANEDIDGYGVHGTIDAASIGRQVSMGCVRLAAPDIALVYELVTEPDSIVEIRE